MSEAQTTKEYMVEKTHNYYLRQVGALVDDLRDLADKVEQHGTHVAKRSFLAYDDLPVYADAATRVVEQVTSGISSSRLSSVIRAAVDADMALRTDPEGEG